MCLAVNLGYAYFSRDGTLFLEGDVKTSDFFQMADLSMTALTRATQYFKVKFRGKKYRFPMEGVCRFTFEFMKCAFEGEFVKQLDGDSVKHAISHGKIMLL